MRLAWQDNEQEAPEVDGVDDQSSS